MSDESEYEVSDRSEKGGASEDEAASSQDLSRGKQRDDVYSDIEEDEDDGVLTRQHVSILSLKSAKTHGSGGAFPTLTIFCRL